MFPHNIVYLLVVILVICLLLSVLGPRLGFWGGGAAGPVNPVAPVQRTWYPSGGTGMYLPGGLGALLLLLLILWILGII